MELRLRPCELCWVSCDRDFCLADFIVDIRETMKMLEA
jgi:hypothetical protein